MKDYIQKVLNQASQGLLTAASWQRHFIWLIAAALTGAVALLFLIAERTARDFTELVSNVSPLLPAATVTVGMILISRLRDKYFQGTEGPGIPQVIAALKMEESSARKSVLSFRVAIGKIILLIIGLFSGATLGREGPSVHVGACFMYLASRFTRFPAHYVKRGLILSGGGAGIAASFNTPIAGIVFAFEEIGRSFEKNNAGLIVRTVTVASIFCIIFLSNYLFYGRVEIGLHSGKEWIAVPIIGITGGFLGGLFAQSLITFIPKFTRLTYSHPYLVSGSLGLTLGVLGIISGGLTYGSGFQEAQNILIHDVGYPVYYPLLKTIASFATLVSAIPGGLFDPTLSVGASLGQLISPAFSQIDKQAVILIAMVAYFSGVVQSPITAFVILLEMTGAYSMSLPLMATSILAYEISHLVCRVSLYEALSDRFLESLSNRN